MAPRRTCGQNISSKIGGDRLAGAEPEAEREEGEAEGGQEAGVELAAPDATASGALEKLRDPGHKHDLVRFERLDARAR